MNKFNGNLKWHIYYVILVMEVEQVELVEEVCKTIKIQTKFILDSVLR